MSAFPHVRYFLSCVPNKDMMW